MEEPRQGRFRAALRFGLLGISAAGGGLLLSIAIASSASADDGTSGSAHSPGSSISGLSAAISGAASGITGTASDALVDAGQSVSPAVPAAVRDLVAQATEALAAAPVTSQTVQPAIDAVAAMLPDEPVRAVIEPATRVADQVIDAVLDTTEPAALPLVGDLADAALGSTPVQDAVAPLAPVLDHVVQAVGETVGTLGESAGLPALPLPGQEQPGSAPPVVPAPPASAGAGSYPQPPGAGAVSPAPGTPAARGSDVPPGTQAGAQGGTSKPNGGGSGTAAPAAQSAAAGGAGGVPSQTVSASLALPLAPLLPLGLGSPGSAGAPGTSAPAPRGSSGAPGSQGSSGSGGVGLHLAADRADTADWGACACARTLPATSAAPPPAPSPDSDCSPD